jgi:acetyl esterase/lipase
VKFAAVGVLLAALTAQAQRTELLWPDGAPGALGEEEADKPSLTVYLPDKVKATGAAIVICPGGGYAHLALDHEGRQVALWLTKHGAAGFVLKYRLGPRYRHPTMLGDAQRALRWVRSRAAEFGVSPDRVGIWGFSAGGHLASTAATQFDAGDPSAAAGIDRQSSRPDFAILAYPVISFTAPFAHAGSRRNLLGDKPDPRLVAELSSETRVTPRTPPVFLFHTTDDKGVPPENSVAFYLALRNAGVPAEMHIYERGRHGVGLAPDDPVLSSWPERLADWLRLRGILAR